MKKIDLNQMASVIGNIGIVAGLILVALELRQTTTNLRAATRVRNVGSALAGLRHVGSEFRLPNHANSSAIVPC